MVVKHILVRETKVTKLSRKVNEIYTRSPVYLEALTLKPIRTLERVRVMFDQS